MALKKYVLKIFYDPITDEIMHLSEQFSDCDQYKLIVNDEEIDVPEEMQEYLEDLDLDDMGVS